MSLDWISKVEFDSKSLPISESDLRASFNMLGKPLSDDEILELAKFCDLNDIKFRDWDLPDYQLPEEYIELLKYSNGGNFCNGDREIGFFRLQDIRSMYISYLFPEFQPGAVPFGFNGGGTFYAYDLRAPSQNPPIIATASGCLDWDESAILGYSLAEVFSKDTNIDDELYY